MFALRRFTFLLACLLLLSKDVTYAFSLSHKLEIQLKQKHLKNSGDFINPFTFNDSAKILLVENEEIEADLVFNLAGSFLHLLPPAQPIGILKADSNLLLPLIIKRIILFCSLKIDC